MSFMGAKAVEDLLKGIGKKGFEEKYGQPNDKRKDETDGKKKDGYCFK